MKHTDQQPPTSASPPNNAQFVYPPGFCPPPEEDETNLLDLLLVLLKHKKMIIYTVGIAAIAAVVISLQLTNIYRSEATIVPHSEAKRSGGLSALGGLGGLASGMLGIGGDSDVTQLEVALNSRELARRVINKYKLMPILFEDDWDPAKKAWTTDNPPTEQDAIECLKGKLSVSVDKRQGTLKVGFNHKDPRFAKLMVDRYLVELSEMTRETIIRDASEKASFVREELRKTSDALLREKLYILLANEIEKETFARARQYYNFDVIDPPIVPDPNKKVKPKRSQICILSVIVAFFLAVFGAFFLEFLHNSQETADPEQREKLRKYLPFMYRNSAEQ